LSKEKKVLYLCSPRPLITIEPENLNRSKIQTILVFNELWCVNYTAVLKRMMPKIRELGSIVLKQITL